MDHEVIPPRMAREINFTVRSSKKGEMKQGHQYLLVPRTCAPGVYVASALVRYDRDVPCRTHIVNTTDKPIRFHAGALLGKLEPHNGELTVMEDDGQLDRMEWRARNPRGWDFAQKVQESMQGSVLDPQQVKQLHALLYKYQDRFAPNPKSPGTTDRVAHDIETGEAKPIKCAPARASPAQQEIIQKAIDEMLDAKVVQPSRSPWASRVVLVTKKDGTPRFCVDYRQLNLVTVKDSYPLPHQQDVMDNMNTAKYFSTMDLASGFWQIKLTEDARAKSAFASRYGLYEFLVMPFGLTNAPATFQRMMDLVLSGLTWVECMVYLDDIIIYSDTWSEHLVRLEHVLKRLREFKLVAKIEKCKFGRESLPFLGHIISAQGVATDPEKLKSVSEIPAPKDVSELRSFLGLTGYYRRFVPNYSDVAEPLHQLLKKNKKYEWTTECEQAMQKLKSALLSAPVLRRPDFKRPFVIHTDASNVGMGAVLEQKDDEGNSHPVLYWSKTFNSAERNYSVTERECLAVVEAIKQFRHYVYGSPFTVVTDHNALKWLRTAKDLSGRLQRWALRLEEHNYTIEYRKGTENANADALSRLGHSDQQQQHHQALVSAPVTRSRPSQPLEAEEKQDEPLDSRLWEWSLNDTWDIVSLEAQDKKAKAIHRILNTEQGKMPLCVAVWHAKGEDENGRPLEFTAADRKALGDHKLSNFVVREGLIYHVHKPKGQPKIYQLIIPPSLQQDYLHSMHAGKGNNAHLGFNKSYEKMQRSYWWPGMYKDVDYTVRSCTRCQSRKTPRTHAALQPNLLTSHPFECVGVDVLGPLPRSTSGYRYIIVFIDHFTRWVEAFPMRKNDARTCAELLVTEIVCRYGAPTKLLSDRGSPFLASMAKEVYHILSIKKLQTTAYHPQTNGIVERFNSTLVAMLAMYVSMDQKDWDKYIRYCVFAYNTSRHELNQFTPYYLVFGREASLPINVASRVDSDIYLSSGEYAQQIIRRMRVAHNLASKNQRSVASEYKTKALAKPPPEFKAGDLVWLRFYSHKIGLSPKLEHMWRGPFEIVERTAPVTYVVSVPGRTRNLKYVTHVNRLKKFYPPKDGATMEDELPSEEERDRMLLSEIQQQSAVEAETAAADAAERAKRQRG